MKISLSWLNEHIDLSNLTVEKIAEAMTEIGFEVEGVYETSPGFKGVVTAQVIETKQHPNADRLTCAVVTDGTDNFPVVCGAPNCREGIKVALAKVGASIDDPEGKSWKIKKSKLRGEPSHGMLCSETELGIGTDASGIIEFPEDTELGVSLEDRYKDTVIEVGLTPNLAHAFCIIGVARDLAAFLNIPLKEGTKELTILPEIKKSKSKNTFDIQIQDEQACPTYGFSIIEEIAVGDSPEWLKKRLDAAGIRSVNNVVDATNYCMIELGQPLHAFDAQLIEDQKIIVRRALDTEAIETLDGKKRNIGNDHLIIADAVKPIAIAGVMGGVNSEVSESSTSILIESAVFDPGVIRKSSKKCFLTTDSSKRFERGVDPNQCLLTLYKATQLILSIAGGKCVELPKLIGQDAFELQSIALRYSRIEKIVGIQVAREEVESIFTRLQFHWTPTEEGWMISIPSYRFDLFTEIDLIEEVARFVGLNKIPHLVEKALPSMIPHSPLYKLENEVRSVLVAERLQETISSSLVCPKKLNALPMLSMNKEAAVVLNPSSEDHSALRTSLICNALDTIRKNQDQNIFQLACFEIGRAYYKNDTNYEEEPIVGVFLTGSTVGDDPYVLKRQVDFYDLKGIIQRVLRALKIDHIEYKNTKHDLFHPGRQARISRFQKELGYMGQIHPSWLKLFNLRNDVYFAQISLKHLEMLRTEDVKYESLSIYPSSQRDWTISLSKSIPYSMVVDWIEQYKGSHCSKYQLISSYEGEKLPEGQHSLSLRFTYQDVKGTLQQQVVDKEHMKMVETIEKIIEN